MGCQISHITYPNKNVDNFIDDTLKKISDVFFKRTTTNSYSISIYLMMMYNLSKIEEFENLKVQPQALLPFIDAKYNKIISYYLK
jgi:hypothetical protein